jgi:hypothetical protein
MRKLFYIIIVFVLFASAAFAKKDIKIFKSIEFKDLNYLSKYEIIDLSDYSIKDNNIIIDMGSLERILNEMPMIKSFKLTEKDQNLSVSIIENQPVFPLCIRDGEKNMFAELDKDFYLISTGRIHSVKMPIIIVSQDEIKNKKISARLKYFLRFLQNLTKSSLGVMNEINEINFTDVNNLQVSLKGRRTKFNIKPDRESFSKLNYAAGYFDRIKYYPHTFTILNEAGILE